MRKYSSPNVILLSRLAYIIQSFPPLMADHSETMPLYKSPNSAATSRADAIARVSATSTSSKYSATALLNIMLKMYIISTTTKMAHSKSTKELRIEKIIVLNRLNAGTVRTRRTILINRNTRNIRRRLRLPVFRVRPATDSMTKRKSKTFQARSSPVKKESLSTKRRSRISKPNQMAKIKSAWVDSVSLMQLTPLRPAAAQSIGRKLFRTFQSAATPR
mmetsp:Transcript_67721/g.161619  ORF Transcript_67721/g.161619 Transcript_67721/m.161619 type:complete len:218 (+) Transcript_67721:813-1466(+)